MGILIVAHRGASKEAPENTMSAFRKAIEHGVDFIETDIQFTKDFVPILFHDKTLKRIIGVQFTMPVSSLQFSDLCAFNAGSHFHPQFKEEKIPMLRQLLELDPTVNLMLEIKHSNFDPKKMIDCLLKEIDQYGSKKAQIILATADPQILDELIKNVSLDKIMGIVDNQAMLSNFMRKSWNLAIDYNLAFANPELVLSHSIWAWTVNHPQIALDLKNRGVCAIITDNPKEMKTWIN